uniref:Spindle and centriole-associated protein 1 n=1 Tax=Rhabditophanes sp. KR3021 TaxID=114890 RepID=A0AC35UBG4_9BILA
MSSIRKASESQIPSVAEEHYRRLLSQISLSNCSLVRENEAMRERLNELEGLLDDHMKHLKSIYFTLHKKGYSKLEFPDGDEVNLAQFEGLLLNFKRSSISGESNGHHHSGGSYLNGTLSGHQYPGSSSLLTDLPTIQEPTTTH